MEYFIEQLLVEKQLYNMKLVDSPNCLYCNNIDVIKAISSITPKN